MRVYRVDIAVVLFTTFWMTQVSSDSVFLHNETRLFAELFTSRQYDRNLFPRCAESTCGCVNVSLDMSLRQIVDLKEQSQVLNAMTWMRWAWTDCRLTWDPDVWGINNLSVSAELLWIPDVTLYEGTQKPLHKMLEYPARLHSDGRIRYNFPAMIDATCKINMANFPFDRQICQLTFASWVYTKRDMDIWPTSSTGDMKNYINNGEWDLLSLKATREEIEYEHNNDVFIEVSFAVVLERRPTYYLFNIIFPTLLIALVAILSFCLPPASGEKVSLSVTSLLTQTVFMLMLSQEMPTTSETIPLLQQYFAVILCVVSVSTILTILVLNLHYRGIHEKHMSPTIKKLFLNKYMARLFHPSISHQFEEGADVDMGGAVHRKSHLGYQNQATAPPFDLDTPPSTSPSLFNGLRFTHVPIESISLNRIPTGFKSQTDSVAQSSPLGKQNGRRQPAEGELLTNLAEMLTRIDDRSRNKQLSKSICKEWGDLAIILDRIFFLICFTGFVVTSIILFTPNRYHF